MNEFNETLNLEIEKKLLEDKDFKLLIVCGKRGLGKSTAINSVLNKLDIKTETISFSEDSLIPFVSSQEYNMLPFNSDTFLMQASKMYQAGICLLIKNMDESSEDFAQILYRLIDFHKSSKQKATTIIEINSERNTEFNTKPFLNEIVSLATGIIRFDSVDNSSFLDYLNSIFHEDKDNQYLFDKLIRICSGNIQNFFCALKILEYEEIIYVYDNEYVYFNKEIRIPDNLLSLYIQLFKYLEEHYQKNLQTAAPFSKSIYHNIISCVFDNYDNFEDYLDEISKKTPFITAENSVSDNAALFDVKYSFGSGTARTAILHQMDDVQTKQMIARYYKYLDDLYNNKTAFDKLDYQDKLLLVYNLSNMRRGNYNINQIKYIVSLMQYYYDNFMYFNVKGSAEQLLNSNILNYNQLNTEYHEFFVVYFQSLIAIGEYDDIIFYKNKFVDSDLNYLIAIAMYNKGAPIEALNVINTIPSQDDNFNIGYKYSLESSIYDWIGDNRKSLKSFEKALKYCGGDSDLTHQLYKKYSMHIDFSMEHCQSKMKSAMEYYENKNIKQYAECLHNYGTDHIKIFSFEKARIFLDKSRKMLKKTCSSEIYHPLNSLAILHCYEDKSFDKAIQLLYEALSYDISIDFCRLALHNNLFNIYIQTNNIELAHTEMKFLKVEFENICAPQTDKNLKKMRPDIQHQLRQFYYNCAFMYKKSNDYAEALSMYRQALDCSDYFSVSKYSICKNIEQLENKFKTSKLGFFKTRNPEPTVFEKFIHENDMYLCEIMFWG